MQLYRISDDVVLLPLDVDNKENLVSKMFVFFLGKALIYTVSKGPNPSSLCWSLQGWIQRDLYKFIDEIKQCELYNFPHIIIEI